MSVTQKMINMCKSKTLLTQKFNLSRVNAPRVQEADQSNSVVIVLENL